MGTAPPPLLPSARSPSPPPVPPDSTADGSTISAHSSDGLVDAFRCPPARVWRARSALHAVCGVFVLFAATAAWTRALCASQPRTMKKVGSWEQRGRDERGMSTYTRRPRLTRVGAVGRGHARGVLCLRAFPPLRRLCPERRRVLSEGQSGPARPRSLARALQRLGVRV